mmetsp:Transcript_3658/g.6937  ORF Transcript_3658/g.6937 Transcript_3658/m.6937 type:complete len:260 (-) Transcript_3658:296-1075(-)
MMAARTQNALSGSMLSSRKAARKFMDWQYPTVLFLTPYAMSSVLKDDSPCSDSKCELLGNVLCRSFSTSIATGTFASPFSSFPCSSMKSRIPLYVISPLASALRDLVEAPEQSHQTCSRISRGTPERIRFVNFREREVSGEERFSFDWKLRRVREWWDLEVWEVRQREVTVSRSDSEREESLESSLVHFSRRWASAVWEDLFAVGGAVGGEWVISKPYWSRGVTESFLSERVEESPACLFEDDSHGDEDEVSCDGFSPS